jgi:hypothetical protein
MVEDCRAGKREGWVFLVTNYLPICRELLKHYYPQRANDDLVIRRLLLALKDSSSGLFRNTVPITEREFLTDLRQAVLAAIEQDVASAAPRVALDFETLTATLGSFTSVEKQIVWFEVLGYAAPETGVMMLADAATVEQIRERAATALRSGMDHWYAGILRDNGTALRALATEAETEKCLAGKEFTDSLDGRTTWRHRQGQDYQLNSCWHCIDHFCRVREVDAMLRRVKPLQPEEAERWVGALGYPPQQPNFWKRLFGG